MLLTNGLGVYMFFGLFWVCMLGSIMPVVFVACQRMLPNSETIINSFLPLIWRNLAVYRLPKKRRSFDPQTRFAPNCGVYTLFVGSPLELQ